jgi:hypothetical protein
MTIEKYSSDFQHIERYLTWLLMIINIVICYLVFKYSEKGKTKNSIFYKCMIYCIILNTIFFKCMTYFDCPPIGLPQMVFVYWMTIVIGGSSYYVFEYFNKNKFVEDDD